MGFETSEARPFAPGRRGELLKLLRRQAIEASIELDSAPNEYFEIAPGYEATFIDLPAGSVDIHVVEVDSVINFTTEMQLALQAQYDNISQASAFSRAIAGNICREASCSSHSDKAR